MPGLHRRADASGGLLRLGAAAMGVFAASGGGYELVRLLIERADPFSFFAPFGGWQLDATAAGLGAFLLALLGVCVLALARIYRGLRGRTPHRRAVIMAALLPGLFLGGGLAGVPLRSAISWASDHTAAAQKMRVEIQTMVPTNPEAPPILFPGVGTPAAPSIAARLLHRSDLGAGWYDGARPNPSQASGGQQGQTLSARSQFTHWHWTGTMWSPGDIALASLRRFQTPTAAQSYLAVSSQDATTHSRIGSVLVFEHVDATGPAKGRTATFAVGTDAFTLTIIGTQTEQEFNPALASAVRRATTGR